MEIFLYTLSVMYSPGPVNFMGLNSGLHGKFKQTLGFFVGVGCAVLFLFLTLGYLGEAIIPKSWLHYIALPGATYTFYMAFKMLNSNVESTNQTGQQLTFLNGFLIQLFNPKGILLILPVTTIMYPAAQITGAMIFVVSLIISIGASGAPLVYALAGSLLGNKISDPKWFNYLNKFMAIMLIVTGLSMLWDFISGMRWI